MNKNTNMYKLFYTLLCLCFCCSLQAQSIKLISTSPANDESVSSVKDIKLTFDLSAVYEAYPEVSQDEWQIEGYFKYKKKHLKLLKGDKDGELLDSKKITVTSEKGSNELSFSFDKATALEEDSTYTIDIGGAIYAIYSDQYYKGTDYESDHIYITLKGAASASHDLALLTHEPSFGASLSSLDTLKLNFNDSVKVSGNAIATIYEGETEIAKSTDFQKASDNNSVIEVVFGNVALYKGHTYSVVVSEGSIVSAYDGNPYGEIEIKEYQGTTVKYECTLVSASPADSSEINYLKDVELRFNMPSGYSVTSTKSTLSLYKDGGTEPIGTYALSPTGVYTASASINNYQLEAGSTYKVIVPAGSIKPYKSSTESLQDTSNPEIVLTYTTPTVIEALPRTACQTASASTDGKITVVIPSFTFEEETTFVRPNTGNSAVTNVYDAGQEKTRTYVTLPILEVVNGEDVDKGTVKLEYNPAPTGAEENYTSLEGAPDFSLYAGHTYKVAIPEGVLYPYTYEGEFKNSIFWNLADTLSFQGVKAVNGLSVTGSSLKAGEALPSVGVVAFYTNEDATVAEGAKALIVKDGETTAAKEATLFTKGTFALADFTDEAHAPFATDSSAVYSIILPEGSLLGPDGILTNAADTVKFTGIIPTVIPAVETVNATLKLDGYATVTLPVVKDSTATFALTPDEGWEVETLTLNGEDVLANYQDSSYTTPALTEDAVIAATFKFGGYAYEEEDVTTGIITAGDTGYSVQVAEGTVTVKGLKAGDTVKAYTLGGALVGSEEAQLNTAKLTLPAGTYIVKVNAVAFKVLVK